MMLLVVIQESIHYPFYGLPDTVFMGLSETTKKSNNVHTGQPMHYTMQNFASNPSMFFPFVATKFRASECPRLDDVTRAEIAAPHCNTT